MQDIQNIPNPDTNSIGNEDDFGNHPDFPDVDKTEIDDSSVDDIPVPPDSEPAHPVKEPPEDVEKPPVKEDRDAPKKIV